MDLQFNSNHYSAVAETLTSIEDVLTSVDRTLSSEDITDDLRTHLLQKLDVASRHLSSLERGASTVNTFAVRYFQTLREKAITLYGKVDDSYLQHEVVVLKDETHDLEDSMNKHDMLGISQRIQQIKDHLNKILSEFRPALEEKRALVAAKLVLDKAEAFIRGEELSDLMLDEQSMLETEALLEEIVEYLAEDTKLARRLLKQRLDELSAAQRKIVSAYLSKDLLHDIEGTAYQNVVAFG
jgi:hypothetical protein